MTKAPQGMELPYFLDAFGDDEWTNEPHLYIVLQQPQALNPPAYRCGAAGTQLFAGSDLPFRSSEASRKGLSGRMTQYSNYWLPSRGVLFAALRVAKRIVALPHQRVGESGGSDYNISRGNQSEVLAKERAFHHFLDQKGLRWMKDRNNELFQPTKVMELVNALRRVQGLQLILFDKLDWREDGLYKGGDAQQPELIREVQQRKVPDRVSRTPSIVVKLDRAFIEQLRAGNPGHYARLVNIVNEVSGKQPEVVQLPREAVDALRTGVADKTTAAAAVRLADEVVERTPRVTRAQAAAATAPRRSARLQGR
jgi:hypothetical protein